MTRFMPDHRLLLTRLSLILSIVLPLGLFQLGNIQNMQGDSPVQLSRPDVIAGPPRIVADSSGGVHVFWAEGDEYGLYNIMYAGLSARGWSDPINVVVSPNGERAQLEDVAIDGSGFIHVVWVSGFSQQLLHSRAYAANAGRVLTWSAPDAIDSRVFPADAFTSPAGDVYIAYSKLDSNQVYLVRSHDSGSVWTDLVSVGAAPGLALEIISDVQVSVDSSGKIFLGWSARKPAGWPGTHLYYASSDNQGASWSLPEIVDEADPSRYLSSTGPFMFNVKAFGDNVFRVWDGPPTGERSYEWSGDGGDTWSGLARVFGDYRGISGINDMVQDSNGTVHMITGGADFLGHVYWLGQEWSDTEVIQTHGGSSEKPRAAITNGNLLHLVWVDENAHQIWYRAVGILDAPSLAPQPLPTLTPSPIPPPTPTPTMVPTSTPLPDFGPPEPDGPLQIRAIGAPVLLGVMPVVVLVLMVALARARLRR